MSVIVSKEPSKRVPGRRESLFVKTDSYDPIFTEKIKLFPLHYYDPGTRSWELPIKSLDLLRRTFSDIKFKGDIAEVKEKQFKDLQGYMEYLKTVKPEAEFDFKTVPDPHQVEFFNEMLNRNGVILADPMGLGKTKETLDICEYRKKALGYKNILFICKSKHKDNMAKEIRTHTDSKYIIVEGPEQKRLQLMRDFYNDDDAYYLIIGYEMAAYHSEQLIKLGEAIGFDAVVMDEFNKVKNYNTSSRRQDDKPHLTVQIVKLIESLNPELKIFCSGTPQTKYPTDLYPVLRMLGVEKRSASQFKNHFCRMDYFGRINGSQNEEELRKELSEVMIRRPKELLQLPEKRVQYMPINMTPEQAKLYRAVQLQIKEEIKGTKAYGAHQLSLLTRLRQVTTNPRLIEADVEGIKENLLAEFLEETFAGGEKAVVFSIYKQETRILKTLYSSLNPAYIDGDVNSKNAMAEVERFQTDPNTKLLIGSLQATKESYTMTAATQAFFLDLSYTCTDNEQAQDRLHRRGQTGIVNIIIPYCLNSIDERVLEILDRDATLIHEVVDGGSTAISREVFEYLLG